MILGTSQVDITPKPGVELSGFAARIQPSVGVLDPLLAKRLYLTQGDARLLWLHCDLTGYADGDMGYLPTRAAYAKGDYEVDVAHLFYGGFGPKAGGLELLATTAAKLVGEVARPCGVPR
jgi:hypothetical protein